MYSSAGKVPVDGEVCNEKMNHCSSTPHHVILEHVFPFLYSETQMKEAVMEAVVSRNVNDLFLLVGSTSGSVPSYLTSDTTFTKSAGFSIMLPVLQGLGFKIARSKFRAASKRGNMDIMKWLHSKDYPWDDRVFTISSRKGDLPIMKWLNENGCPWSEYTFAAAAYYGNLENMKWLNENGCPLDAIVSILAVDNGKLENIRWLKEKGCPWDVIALEQIRRKGDPATLALFAEELGSTDEEPRVLSEDYTAEEISCYEGEERESDDSGDDSDQEEDEEPYNLGDIRGYSYGEYDNDSLDDSHYDSDSDSNLYYSIGLAIIFAEVLGSTDEEPRVLSEDYTAEDISCYEGEERESDDSGDDSDQEEDEEPDNLEDIRGYSYGEYDNDSLDDSHYDSDSDSNLYYSIGLAIIINHLRSWP